MELKTLKPEPIIVDPYFTHVSLYSVRHMCILGLRSIGTFTICLFFCNSLKFKVRPSKYTKTKVVKLTLSFLLNTHNLMSVRDLKIYCSILHLMSFLHQNYSLTLKWMSEMGRAFHCVYLDAFLYSLILISDNQIAQFLNKTLSNQIVCHFMTSYS